MSAIRERTRDEWAGKPWRKVSVSRLDPDLSYPLFWRRRFLSGYDSGRFSRVWVDYGLVLVLKRAHSIISMVMVSFVEYCDSRSARIIPEKGAGSGRFFPVWFDSRLAFCGQVPIGINLMEVSFVLSPEVKPQFQIWEKSADLGLLGHLGWTIEEKEDGSRLVSWAVEGMRAQARTLACFRRNALPQPLCANSPGPGSLSISAHFASATPSPLVTFIEVGKAR